eukprot:GEMP01061228.1.p1 GENE.GEMP01061228.1~~GEMP01061228.1.p1  ORF type:complete len:178 (+),score=39.30 GEMP01061228.1:108-641(+)
MSKRPCDPVDVSEAKVLKIDDSAVEDAEDTEERSVLDTPASNEEDDVQPSVQARYLNGDEVALEQCSTINGVRVGVANRHNRFAPDVVVLSIDSALVLSDDDAPLPPPRRKKNLATKNEASLQFFVGAALHRPLLKDKLFYMDSNRRLVPPVFPTLKKETQRTKNFIETTNTLKNLL